MKTLYTIIFLLVAGISQSNAQQTETGAATEPVYSMLSSTSKKVAADPEDIKRDRARLAITELLRAVFNTTLNEQAVTLNIDAGWRDDSLSIEYKYYRGHLIEKIYFTFLPGDISAMSADNEEFLFLNFSSKKAGIRKLISASPGRPAEISNIGSFAIPVNAGNLELIKKTITEIR